MNDDVNDDKTRDQIIGEARRRLIGSPALKFINQEQERKFKDALTVERSRPSDVVYRDRFMDVFQFTVRWLQNIMFERRLCPNKSIEDVAERAAFEAGLYSADTGRFLATASRIAITCWAEGPELGDWFKGSGFYRFLPEPRPLQMLTFPSEYLDDLSPTRESELGG